MGAIANYYRITEPYVRAIDETLKALADLVGVPREVFGL